MKKIFYSILAALAVFSFPSCSDMLDVDNPSMVVDPELNQKTDSVFYALGIAQAMQCLADQYYYIGEMRGDLVQTNGNTESSLRTLSDYSATTANAYDSAYVYYKVINNCNYYLAHRDTSLYTSAKNVVIDEYAAVAAYRAWAYLQLARTYGDNIPFFTEPLTSISQVEQDHPRYSLSKIVDALAPQLEQFSKQGVTVPNLGNGTYSVGAPNWTSTNKNIIPSKIFIPVDVILGEMYLEDGRYSDAAQKYCKYLGETQKLPEQLGSYNNNALSDAIDAENKDVENYLDFSSINNPNDMWTSMFQMNYAGDEIITYIPMAVSNSRGKTSTIPTVHGYDFYSFNRSRNCPRNENIQIMPSNVFSSIVATTPVYYFSQTAKMKADGQLENPDSVGSMMIGDMRASYGETTNNTYMLNRVANDTTKVYIRKASTSNVILYRVSTIYLHLAEALNRMEYPDAAFAILKNGISPYLEELQAVPGSDGTIPAYSYIQPKTIDMLTNQVPFLSTYRNVFTETNSFGIHSHGAAFVNRTRLEGEEQSSPKGGALTSVGSKLNTDYLPAPQIAKKMKQIADKYNVAVGTTLQDSINAMEDILCDEYALEFAFEGNRFYDLQRLARHKNESGIYGGNFGSLWLKKKIEDRGTVAKDLTSPANWYLPFQ